MESSSSRQTTLASIIDTEKVIPPPRARALLASLAQARNVPAGPASVREWSEAIGVERDAAGAERAVFTGATAPTRAADEGASVIRHIDALRAAAVAMLWGRESAQGPDGQPRYPRLRKLLVDQWEETRATCEGPDKLMMFFDATLALDRAAEPKAGREGFKTLSIESMEAAKKPVRVGTIGVPFQAIIDTGKFKKANRPAPAAPADPPSAPKHNQGPWLTPQVPTITQSSGPPSAPDGLARTSRSMARLVAGIVVGMLLLALAFVYLAR